MALFFRVGVPLQFAANPAQIQSAANHADRAHPGQDQSVQDQPSQTQPAQNPGAAAEAATSPAPGNPSTVSPAPTNDIIEIPTVQIEPTPPAPSTVAETPLPSFVSASFEEMRRNVPDLRGLRPAASQQELPGLLGKIGAKTLELFDKTPDLIAREFVVESFGGQILSRETFSYLMLAKRRPDMVTLVEFRVDLATGNKLESDDIKLGPASEDPYALWKELFNASQHVLSTVAPMGQGFSAMWLNFYPANRPLSAFRYLGRQKISGHKTYVLAYAQKPELVSVPGQVQFGDKTIPVYFQGVAWVDESSFCIVRMHTDLEAPVPQLRLHRLTSDVQLAEMPVAGFDASLWLPREVLVTSQMGATIVRDKHTYSQYRAFRVHTKMILKP